MQLSSSLHRGEGEEEESGRRRQRIKEEENPRGHTREKEGEEETEEIGTRSLYGRGGTVAQQQQFRLGNAATSSRTPYNCYVEETKPLAENASQRHSQYAETATK